MENQQLSQIKGNAKNPRTISKHDFDALKKSITTFGDLSGIVFNQRTGQLAGGHQRREAFLALGNDAAIEITKRFDAPNSVGTVAVGHVTLNDETYAYRVVDWDASFETAANVAANRIQGEFDKDLLAELVYEINQLENGQDLTNLMGLEQDEYKKLLDMVSGEPDIDLPDGDKPGFQNMTFTLSDEQAEIINEAMGHVKSVTSFDGMENQNSNGNALYFVARDYLDRLHGLNDGTS